MMIGNIGVAKALKKSEKIACACLGTIFSVPMTKITLFENLFMAIMALYMVIEALKMPNIVM